MIDFFFQTLSLSCLNYVAAETFSHCVIICQSNITSPTEMCMPSTSHLFLSFLISDLGEHLLFFPFSLDFYSMSLPSTQLSWDSELYDQQYCLPQSTFFYRYRAFSIVQGSRKLRKQSHLYALVWSSVYFRLFVVNLCTQNASHVFSCACYLSQKCLCI